MIDICESSGSLQALFIIKSIFRIICFILPIILIFFLSLDIYKLVSSPDEKKKVFPIVSKRLIAAIIILFIPTIVRITLNVLGNGSDFQRCYNNANSDYIEYVKTREKYNKKTNASTNTQDSATQQNSGEM